MKKNNNIVIDAYGYSVSPCVNEHDEPIKRTPATHPYSYDGFVTWRGGENKEANNTVYSDRIIRENHSLYNSLSKKHFGDEGQYFHNREPEKIESFLRDWCKDPELKLIFVMEYCNVSSGYPLWRFDFKQTKK